MVTISTSMGDIKVELFEAEAPETTKNFLQYIQEGHYNNVIFHRVIDGFMVQGGGFDTDFNEKPTRDSIKNEADNGLSNDTGTLAMARTPDPHSASAQFFINVNDNTFLNHQNTSPQGYGYCVFGKVVDGMDVVNQIKGVATGSRGGHDDVPVENVVITSMTAD